MKRQLALLAAFGALGTFAAQAAYDGTVTISGSTGTSGGGPFSVSITQGPGTGLNGASSSFLSFCLERNEYLSYGPSYNVIVNTAAVNGGLGGGSPDPISAATAWIYSNFIAGNLGAYTGDEIQNAIWHFEDEGAVVGPNAALVAAATAGAVGAPAGLWGVRAMNLYDANGVASQDLLVVVPEPSTYIAGGLALLPLLFGLRSRLAKK